MSDAVAAGRVVLVGGGPGSLDLLTLRALRELEQADVIVADRLGPRDELARLDLSAEIIDVGKSPHHHPVPQGEINAILVREARAGRRVVRLKGGDPYLLGRGGEEYLSCHAHGIDVDVVPGVTSALSAPLAGGIPVTHRGSSAGLLVLSGHDELALPALAAWHRPVREPR
ncbi:MAG TPA: uroporphyrinogen-III C-methyltransferase [Dermacoccus sp.]|nr:uroporphyrinogen-III C-methyltransferase [Dermacoccus sp.]